MKAFALFALIVAAAAALCFAAPAPYPLVVNSQSSQLNPIIVYRGSPYTIRAQFVDGTTSADITGYTPFASWSSNATATGIATAGVSIVNATNGQVDLTFPATAFNFAPGRYVYEIGLSNQTVRNGVLDLRGSPYTAGATNLTFGTNLNFASFDGYTSADTYGPYAAGSNVWFRAVGSAGRYYIDASVQSSGQTNVTHNSLLGLNTGDYQHLTAAELAVATNAQGYVDGGFMANVQGAALTNSWQTDIGDAGTAYTNAWVAADAAQSAEFSNTLVAVAGDTMTGDLNGGGSHLTNWASVAITGTPSVNGTNSYWTREGPTLDGTNTIFVGQYDGTNVYLEVTF